MCPLCVSGRHAPASLNHLDTLRDPHPPCAFFRSPESLTLCHSPTRDDDDPVPSVDILPKSPTRSVNLRHFLLLLLLLQRDDLCHSSSSSCCVLHHRVRVGSKSSSSTLHVVVVVDYDVPCCRGWRCWRRRVRETSCLLVPTGSVSSLLESSSTPCRLPTPTFQKEDV